MMSSTMPSREYSCSGSELRLVKGRTASEGLLEAGGRFRLFEWDLGGRHAEDALSFLHRPTNRKALPGSVLIRRCSSPESQDGASSGIQAGCQRCIGDDARPKWS